MDLQEKFCYKRVKEENKLFGEKEDAKKRSFVKSVLLLCFIMSLVMSFNSLQAIAYPSGWTPDVQFQDFWQKDSGVNSGNMACAEVAATDSLWWLSTKYNLPNLIQGKTWQGLANTLETSSYMNLTGNGTYSGKFVDGKTNYINSVGYGSQIQVEKQLGGQGTAPTIDWIKSQVALGQDVEVEIGWIKQVSGGTDTWLGGHFVAVTGYDEDNLKIADPWTDSGANISEILQINNSGQTTLSFDAYGNYKSAYTLTYPRVTINDGLSFSGTNYEIIFAAVAESVPEPSTILLLGFSLGYLIKAGRKRK